MSTLSFAACGGDVAAADNARALGRAAEYLRTHPGTTLVIPPGTYHLHPALAQGTFQALANHDNGAERRVGLLLDGVQDATISAHGARFSLHGQMTPVLAQHCRGLAIEGLAIDWEVPLHAWGVVVGGWQGFLDVRIVGGHPWRIVRERLVFLVNGVAEPLWGTYACDAVTRGNLKGSGDHCGTAWGLPWVVEDLGEGIVRLQVHTPKVPPPGTILILRHGDRLAPAIAAVESQDIRLAGVTIHHASGMGLIAQHCTDVTVRDVSVIPSGDRPFSTNHDATHFVGCRGRVEVLRCRTSHHLDDAVNAHGIFAPVVAQEADRVLVRLAHPQQRGVGFAVAGDRVAVVAGSTLQPVADLDVLACRFVASDLLELTVNPPCPQGTGLVLENRSAIHDLVVQECDIRHNRARGVLATPGGRVRITGTTFSTPGAAILVAGDARSWYESGATASLEVEGNHFIDCAVGGNGWGDAVVVVKPEIDDAAPAVHGPVTLTGNTVSGACGRLADIPAQQPFTVTDHHGTDVVVRRG